MDNFLDLVQRRVANVSIAPSTVRNMGKKGIVQLVRDFFYPKEVLEGLASTIAADEGPRHGAIKIGPHDDLTLFVWMPNAAN